LPSRPSLVVLAASTDKSRLIGSSQRMPGFRSPLDAYREDLSRAPGRKRLAAGDEFWIVLATGLRRLAQAPARSRRAGARRLASALVTFGQELDSSRSIRRPDDLPPVEQPGQPSSVAAALSHFPDAEFASAFLTTVRAAAADAEEAGAVILAREILTDLRELTSYAPVLDRGLILIQLGRIARSVGDLDSAKDLLAAADELSRDGVSLELETRVAAAQAVLARTRGNYPIARTLFESAMAGAQKLGLDDVAGLAHHGLMIVTAEAGDFDTALHHGWHALSAARAETAREAEMFTNLAQLCAKAGYDAAALGGFTAALARATAPRLRLPALAGTVAAAGRLQDATRVASAARAIELEANAAFPYETSRAWLSVARAKRALGDNGAADVAAERAADIAREHGFHEITHHAEQEVRPTPAALSRAGQEVVRSLETWSDGASIVGVFSSVSTG